MEVCLWMKERIGVWEQRTDLICVQWADLPWPSPGSLPSLFSFSRRDLADVPVPAISPRHAKAQDHRGQETFLIALGG